MSIETQWPLINLGEVVDVKIGNFFKKGDNSSYFSEYLWVSISEMKGQIITDTKEKITEERNKKSNVKLIPKGTTLLSFKLALVNCHYGKDFSLMKLLQV